MLRGAELGITARVIRHQNCLRPEMRGSGDQGLTEGEKKYWLTFCGLLTKFIANNRDEPLDSIDLDALTDKLRQEALQKYNRNS